MGLSWLGICCIRVEWSCAFPSETCYESWIPFDNVTRCRGECGPCFSPDDVAWRGSFSGWTETPFFPNFFRARATGATSLRSGICSPPSRLPLWCGATVYCEWICPPPPLPFPSSSINHITPSEVPFSPLWIASMKIWNQVLVLLAGRHDQPVLHLLHDPHVWGSHLRHHHDHETGSPDSFSWSRDRTPSGETLTLTVLVPCLPTLDLAAGEHLPVVHVVRASPQLPAMDRSRKHASSSIVALVASIRWHWRIPHLDRPSSSAPCTRGTCWRASPRSRSSRAATSTIQTLKRVSLDLLESSRRHRGPETLAGGMLTRKESGKWI